jgi:hypothetical protein
MGPLLSGTVTHTELTAGFAQCLAEVFTVLLDYIRTILREYAAKSVCGCQTVEIKF